MLCTLFEGASPDYDAVIVGCETGNDILFWTPIWTIEGGGRDLGWRAVHYITRVAK